MVNPAYVFRPTQVFRRVRRVRTGRTVVRLPWGDRLEVVADEQIGDSLVRCAVHELETSEALWRLTGPGDRALDVGANIGYDTSLLAHRSAEVTAFEPHPELRATLERNVARWGRSNVIIDPRAVSDHSGHARLGVPPSFDFVQGTATLEATENELTSFDVETIMLDELLTEPVGVMKLDVEGHELGVLLGSEHLLSAGAIRDIVFEDHHAADSRVFECLRGYGYTLFGIAQTFLGIHLVEALSHRAVPRWGAPNYLATLDPERVAGLMRPRGWHCLRA